ncbi:hypothetical protein N7507_011836 [Penicillium longicatenatum]|nr:hypothetical protein N7507_011836 [Penicillium longicatenatum]
MGQGVCVEVKLLTSITSIAPLILYEYFCCDVCISSPPDRAPLRRWILRGFKSQSTAGGVHLPQVAPSVSFLMPLAVGQACFLTEVRSVAVGVVDCGLLSVPVVSRKSGGLLVSGIDGV